ncbi:MAG: hypothetical protein JST40_14185 [Armatimonadetes bacterium]|nr:hypothetical protein [Armatimonadota bacterium]
MVVVGDVFAVVSILVGVFLTGFAAIFGLGLLFGGKVETASMGIETAPFKRLILGIGVGLPMAAIAIALASVPMPLVKLFGITMLMFVLAIALFGMSGLSWLISKRMRHLDPSTTPQQAFSRATMILVGASLFPLVGWFLIAPMAIFAGFGTGLVALFKAPEAQWTA